jgi:hypothetical protein
VTEGLANVDRETRMLLPVEMRDWLSGIGVVRFVTSAVESMERVGQVVDLYVAITSEDNSRRRCDSRPPQRRAGKKVTHPRVLPMGVGKAASPELEVTDA